MFPDTSVTLEQITSFKGIYIRTDCNRGRKSRAYVEDRGSSSDCFPLPQRDLMTSFFRVRQNHPEYVQRHVFVQTPQHTD